MAFQRINKKTRKLLNTRSVRESRSYGEVRQSKYIHAYDTYTDIYMFLYNYYLPYVRICIHVYGTIFELQCDGL